jgi:hypothetical protein
MNEAKSQGAVPGACLCGAIQYEIDVAPLGHQCIESKAAYITAGDDLPQWEGAGELETPQD